MKPAMETADRPSGFDDLKIIPEKKFGLKAVLEIHSC